MFDVKTDRKPSVEKKTNRVARGVSGKKLNFKEEFMSHISIQWKTLKSKVYVLQITSNWIVLFDLWQLPISYYWNRVNVSSKGKNKETEKLIEDLKNCFPRVFSVDLGKRVKIKVKFELKENVKTVLKPSRKVPFAALEQVNEELERLEKLGVISKINYLAVAKKKRLSTPSTTASEFVRSGMLESGRPASNPSSSCYSTLVTHSICKEKNSSVRRFFS